MTKRTVSETVKDGVRAGVFGLHVDDEIYFGRDVPEAYLEKALLIPADSAPKLVAAPPPEETKPEKPVPPPAPPETRPKTQYQVLTKVPPERLSDFFRGVILPLREAADNLEVEIRVRAKKEEGLPQGVLEQKVRETLRQLGVQILEERTE